MHKFGVSLLLIFFCIGCGGSFKSNFKDFNAYYNTFYNAKKSYKSGLEKSLSQKRDYNTLQPIRIYQTPKGAGDQDFQRAIDKGADILREHRETKWVDDALLIIGQSYFFKSSYFAADQKFDELYLSTTNPVMKQKAVFWKGRVLLELQAYNAGVRYLNEQLSEFEDEWRKDLRFQVQTVLAEHYIKRENWVTALDLLIESVPELPKKELKERGYFLIGQLNEILGNPEEAFLAYDKVEDNYVEYDLQFEAKKKKAEVARAIGETNEAYKVFFSMVRDDKNTEFISELNFELGKTEQERGNYEEAEKIYKRILTDKVSQPEPVTKARVYNGLAEINRFVYDDFARAAAYYDSASKVNVQIDQLPEEFQAAELANSFGEYARLKNNIQEEDSLLRLGRLPQDEFDSVLVVIERQKREELERLQKEREEKQNTLVNVNNTGQTNTGNSEQNGFLNIENPVLLADAKQQFQAIWEGRPLADNWRVSSLISNVIEDNTAEGVASTSSESRSEKISVNIDLSRIPFTPADQDSVEAKIAELKYQLGNLFFLSLNLPDSAVHYFQMVLESRPQSKVAPVALYSLSELREIDNDTEQSRSYAKSLIDKYPGSLYAERVAEKYNLDLPYVEKGEGLTANEIFINISSDSTISGIQKADSLFSFSLSNKSAKIAPKAYYDGIQILLKQAKSGGDFDDKLATWNEVHNDWDTKTKNFAVLKDSAQSTLNDSTINLASTDSLFYESILDSTLTQPDFSEYFPYEGALWDSTRNRLDTFQSLFSGTDFSARINLLSDELKVPEETQTQPQEETEVIAESDESGESEYLSCEELNSEVFIRGGKDNFINSVNISDRSTGSEISFLFFINQRGIIDEFQLASDIQNQALITSFVSAIEDNLSFDPVLVEGQASKVKCEIVFEY